MINRENLVKIGRAGGKTSNRETPDQIGRVGISATGFIVGNNLCLKILFITNYKTETNISDSIAFLLEKESNRCLYGT